MSLLLLPNSQFANSQIQLGCRCGQWMLCKQISTAINVIAVAPNLDAVADNDGDCQMLSHTHNGKVCCDNCYTHMHCNTTDGKQTNTIDTCLLYVVWSTRNGTWLCLSSCYQYHTASLPKPPLCSLVMMLVFIRTDRRTHVQLPCTLRQRLCAMPD